MKDSQGATDAGERVTRIYFAGSISGGRDDQRLYRRIIDYLGKHGQVLTEHIGNLDLSADGELETSEADIYRRDMAWLAKADIVVAEVTTPSLGVGYEMAAAEQLDKPVLCLFRPCRDRRLSAMLAGNPHLTVRTYRDWSEIPPLIDEYISSVKVGRRATPS